MKKETNNRKHFLLEKLYRLEVREQPKIRNKSLVLALSQPNDDVRNTDAAKTQQMGMLPDSAHSRSNVFIWSSSWRNHGACGEKIIHPYMCKIKIHIPKL